MLQLEQSLATLGFFRLTPDTKFTPGHQDGRQVLAEVLGAEAEPGRSSTAGSSSPPRMCAFRQAKAKAGSVASGEIISVTGVQKEIAVFLDTSSPVPGQEEYQGKKYPCRAVPPRRAP